MGSKPVIHVLGGGLAGTEAAWQIARAGLECILYEMRPARQTAAHRTGDLAELVCSNSLKSDAENTASWLLKEELRRLGSLGMEAAARAKQRHPRMLVMVRLLDTRVTVDSTRAVFGGRLPEIFHTERVGAGMVASLHALGVKVFMNVVQWEGYVQPVKYLAIGWILGTRLDFILTDEPVQMMRRAAGS